MSCSQIVPCQGPTEYKISYTMFKYHHKFSGNSVDPDQTAPDEGLHSLPFCHHLLHTLLYGKTTLFNFYVIYSRFFGGPNCLEF